MLFLYVSMQGFDVFGKSCVSILYVKTTKKNYETRTCLFCSGLFTVDQLGRASLRVCRDCSPGRDTRTAREAFFFFAGQSLVQLDVVAAFVTFVHRVFFRGTVESEAR